MTARKKAEKILLLFTSAFPEGCQVERTDYGFTIGVRPPGADKAYFILQTYRPDRGDGCEGYRLMTEERAREIIAMWKKEPSAHGVAG